MCSNIFIFPLLKGQLERILGHSLSLVLNGMYSLLQRPLVIICGQSDADDGLDHRLMTLMILPMDQMQWPLLPVDFVFPVAIRTSEPCDTNNSINGYGKRERERVRWRRRKRKWEKKERKKKYEERRKKRKDFLSSQSVECGLSKNGLQDEDDGDSQCKS